MIVDFNCLNSPSKTWCTPFCCLAEIPSSIMLFRKDQKQNKASCKYKHKLHRKMKKSCCMHKHQNELLFDIKILSPKFYQFIIYILQQVSHILYIIMFLPTQAKRNSKKAHAYFCHFISSVGGKKHLSRPLTISITVSHSNLCVCIFFR